MARDVKFWKDDGSFKLRVCGIIKYEDKYLIDNCDNCSFWSFPGGHVKLGENTDKAVVREVYEETKLNVKIEKLIATIQLFFNRNDDMPFHEIGYYYLLKSNQINSCKDFSLQELDEGKLRNHEFKWVTIEEMGKIDIRPRDLINVLKNDLERQHIIHDDRI